MTPNPFQNSDFEATVRLDLDPVPDLPSTSLSPLRRRHTDGVAPASGVPLALPAMPVSVVVPAALSVKPMPVPAPVAKTPAVRALRLFVRGFNAVEKKLLEGTVRLSQRRLPRLELVSEHEASAADLVMIDGSDEQAVAWGESQPWLAHKTAIWVDSRFERPGHTLSRRPVQWPLLPMMLARALEHGATARPQRAPVSNCPAEAPAAQRSQNARHVLVVDDSLVVRNQLRSLLEARGLQVSVADCVTAALAAVATQRFSCALMDVLMPDMDGYEGCKRIKSLKASIGPLPVVMLTSKSSPFDRIRGKMAGCDAYLTKPVEPHDLFEVLARHIGTIAAPVLPPAAAARRAAAPAWPSEPVSSSHPPELRSIQWPRQY